MNELLKDKVQNLISDSEITQESMETFSSEFSREIKEYDPLQMALILKDVYNGDARLIAIGLKGCECTHKAVRIGHIILNKQIYPDTPRDVMYDILKDVFPDEDTDQAIGILYPLTLDVKASEIWTDTKSDILNDESVTVTYISGKWMVSPWPGWCDARGNGIAGKPGYAMEKVSEGCLIGKLGADGHPFEIGEGCTFKGESGRLYLTANDDVNGDYGAGYEDNGGSIVVKITRELM